MGSGTRFGIPRAWAFRILSQNSFTSTLAKVRVKMVRHKLENTSKSPKSTEHFFGAIFRAASFFTQLIGIFYTVFSAEAAAPATSPILPRPPLNTSFSEHVFSMIVRPPAPFSSWLAWQLVNVGDLMHDGCS